ncbi:MAG: ATP-binding protein [Bacteroidia bacterium]|nr:ATP-binding protein [Bacteroidia bacterium]
MKPPLKIAVVGPESTGKTTLTQKLADFFHTSFAQEVARDYLHTLKRPYTQPDLTQIARLQLAEEKRAEQNAREVFFADTNLLVIKVWSEYKYQSCDPWILENMKLDTYDVHFLTGTDIPWEEDPLREHPEQRDDLYEIYRRELSRAGVLFYELKGNAEQRLSDAVIVIRILLATYR